MKNSKQEAYRIRSPTNVDCMTDRENGKYKFDYFIRESSAKWDLGGKTEAIHSYYFKVSPKIAI